MRKQTIVRIGKLVLFFAFGYLFSHYIRIGITDGLQGLGVRREIVAALSRFAVLGYAIPLLLAEGFRRPEHNLWRIGDFRAEIRFPLIWRGQPDPVWRFLLIFAGCMAFVAAFAIYWRMAAGGTDWMRLLWFGLLFSIVNSVLEEAVWRGQLLSRQAHGLGEAKALLWVSFCFGLSHYDLGFSLPVCLAFAVGGFFMGGAALRSRGLLAPMLMHFVMNMVFVLFGMII